MTDILSVETRRNIPATHLPANNLAGKCVAAKWIVIVYGCTKTCAHRARILQPKNLTRRCLQPTDACRRGGDLRSLPCGVRRPAHSAAVTKPILKHVRWTSTSVEEVDKHSADAVLLQVLRSFARRALPSLSGRLGFGYVLLGKPDRPLLFQLRIFRIAGQVLPLHRIDIVIV